MRIANETFRGEAPRVAPELLPENAAQSAINARLQSGNLESWRQFAIAKTLTIDSLPETIYLLDDQWLSWGTDVDVARGVIPGDNTFRVYLTGPDEYNEPRFTNYAMATTGSEPFPVETRPLGVPAPESPPTLQAGVSTLASDSTTEVLDNGDALALAWTTSATVSTTFTRSIVSQDAGDGNGAPSYSLQVAENFSAPAYLLRDFGIDGAQVIEVSYDFKFNAATYKRMQANIAVDSTGAGLSIHWDWSGGFSICLAGDLTPLGLSGLVSANAGAPSDGVWYTVQTRIVTNANNTRTVTATLYQGSSQIVTVTCTNAFTNRGGYVGFAALIAEAGGAPDLIVRYDNILVRSTSPADTITQTPTSYIYTFVNDLDEESAPSLPSATILKDDGTAITVTTPTDTPSGTSADYHIETKRIYRAVIGSTGTVFKFVAEIPLAQADYVDELTDDETGDPLETELWDLPPNDLRGILALPNGIMVGFRRNQLCFSVQNRPHAWPVEWRLNTDTDIVGIGNIDNTVVIGTEAFPYLAVGNDPSAYSMSKLEKKQACVSKRSITHITGVGVLFASPDGYQSVAANGRISNITEGIFTRRQWEALTPTSIRAVEHDDICFFFPEGVSGFALDQKQTGFGLIELSFHATAMFSDPLSDKLYMVLDAADEPTDPYLSLPSTLPEVGEHTNNETITDAPGDWTSVVAPSSYYWRGLAVGPNGVAVAGGRNPAGGAVVVMFTNDGGQSWANASVLPTMAAGGQGIPEAALAYGGGLFAAAGQSKFATSPDGDVWTTSSETNFTGGTTLFWTGQRFCVLIPSSGKVALTSDGGVTSVLKNLPSAGPSWAAGGRNTDTNRLLIVASSGQTAYSDDDGDTWTAGGDLPDGIGGSSGASFFVRPVYGNGTWVVAPSAANARMWYSTDDGLTWQASNVLPGGVGTVNMYALVFAQGLFIGWTNVGQATFYSADGVTWTKSTNNIPVNAATWDNVETDGSGLFIAVANVSSGSTFTAYSGQFVITTNTNIFEFDSDTSYGDLVVLYRGKLNLLPRPTCFVYCQVKATDYVNLVARFYADGDLIFSTLVTSEEPFTLPLSDEYTTFEIELVGTSRVRAIQVVEDIRELN